MFVLTVCILRHLKNRQRILESFLIFSNSFTETWNDRQNCRNTWDSPARKKRKTVMRKHGWQLKGEVAGDEKGKFFVGSPDILQALVFAEDEADVLKIPQE